MSWKQVKTEEEARLRRSTRIAQTRRGDMWSGWEQPIDRFADRDLRDSWSVESVVGTELDYPIETNRMSKKVVDSDEDSGRGSEQPGLMELFQLMMADSRRRDAEAKRRDEEYARREERWAAQ